MRKLLIGLAAIVVVLVAAVLVVPSLIDWNGYKPEIQAAVRKATGRDIKLDGSIGLSVLPSPSLSVEKVSFANIEGGSTPDMVTLDSLRVHVALLPLLSGKVHVTSVTLVKPTIVLEKLADGRANWELGTGSAASAGSSSASTASGGEEGGGAPAVALDSATIEGGTILYKDAAAGSEQRIEGLNAKISAGGLQGPFEVSGSVSYQGVPLTLEASVGQLDGGRPTSVKATVSAADKALTATANGMLELAARPGFKGEVRIDAPDLGKAVERLAGALGSAPPAVGAGQALAVSANVEGSPSVVTVSDLAVALGESRLQGGVEVALDKTVTVDAKLSGNRLDLDALLPAAAAKPAAAEAPSKPAASSGSKDTAVASFALPTGISGSVDVSVDAVQYRGGSIRKVRLAGDLVDGTAIVRLATAQLPGGTEMTLTGTTVAGKGEPHFVGRVEAVSDNLRSTLDWAGVDTTGVAPDRLHKASVKAAVDATPTKVEVTDWTMELDATKAKGGLTLVMRDRPAFGLSLEVDRINLDAYMPAADKAKVAPAKAGSSASASAAAAGSKNPLSALTAVDANVNIRVGEATAYGVPVRDARIDALLQNGTLTLRDVGVADLGGARATVAGVLRDAAGKPSVDMSFDVTVVNVDRFARLLSTESPISAKQLGQVSMKGTAAGDMQNVKVDAVLAAAGGRVGLKGTAKPLTSPPTVDLAVTMSHPDANKLAAVFAPGALNGVGKLGPLDGTWTIRTRDDGRYANKLDLSVAGASVALVGNADPFAKVPDVDMAIEASHSDAVKLIRTFSPGYKPAGKNLGGVRVYTRFKGPVDNLKLFETDLGLGAIKATGEGTLVSTGKRPALTLALSSNKVEIDPWLPPSAPKPAGAAPAAPVPVASSREWSRERIDTSGLSAIDADIKAVIESIVYGSYVVDNAQLAATVKDGVLNVSKLAGGMFGGTFDMTAQVADRETPTAALTVKVRDADVRKAVETAAGNDMVSGILTYDTDLKTQGTSEFELVSALNGNGSFSVKDGVVKGFDLRAFSDQLKALDRAPDFVQLAQKSLSGGQTKFSALTGTYTVSKGVLRSNDIKLAADAGAGTATAVVDLPPQQMDVNASFRLTDHPNAPPVGVRLVGPLDNPRRILQIEEMQTYVLQRMVERGVLKQLDKNGKVKDLLNGIQGGQTDSTQSGTTPSGTTQSGTTNSTTPDSGTSPQTVKPEDAVKGLLKGLLK